MVKNNFSKNYKQLGLTLTFSIFSLILVLSACNKKDDDIGLKADFNFEYTDDNHVKFENISEGEYYSMVWNFGNGNSDTTTNKNQDYQIYYPVAGDYEVSLKLFNYTGGSTIITKIINIANTELQLAFATNIDDTNPNHVHLTNTTIGNYDSFKWKFRQMEIEDETEYDAYFPFAGNYEIELEVVVNNNIFSLKKSISIAQDDPNYVPNLTLVWSDEFDGNNVDLNFWTFETGSGGWGNQELQNYTNGNNAEVNNGILIITARKENDNMVAGSYTSTRIITKGKKEFQYGKIEIRAKLPSGTGIWPAIWMLGSNIGSAGWPACGEIDIMEYVGYQPNVVHATIHTTSGSGGNGNGSSYNLNTCEEEFHNYGILWNEDKIQFYVDSTENIIHTYSPPVKTAANWPFDQQAFFILNVAVGGTWGGAQGIDNSIFPQTMEIDYVRVYQEVK